MQIVPTLEKVQEIASARRYRVLPVSCEILSDFTTPIEAMRILKQVSTHCYMLESAASHETWGRYTFLGFDPSLEITCRNGEMRAGCLHFPTADPSAYLRQVLEEHKSPRFDHLPPFTGGLVGYFSYDYLGYSEPSVRAEVEDSEEFRDLDLMLFDKVIAFDHLRQKLILMVNMSLDEPETSYNKAVLELRQLVELLRTGAKKQDRAGRLLGPVTPLFGREDFCRMVEQAKVHIREGDIFQIVLSNCLSAPFEGSLFNTYRVLRTLNPSPYMFYFSGTDVEVAGASPETLVKLENGVLHTFPLAGTRPRGKTLERIFEAMLGFLDASGAATVAFAQGGDFIGGLRGGNFKKRLLRKAMNSFFCRVDRPIQFRGTMNEDVTTYTTLGSRGELFFTFVDVHIIQIPTQSLGGGMTAAYRESGTYLKTFYSVMSMPSCIKVGMMYSKNSRIHHRIDWECCVPKILNEKYRKER